MASSKPSFPTTTEGLNPPTTRNSADARRAPDGARTHDGREALRSRRSPHVHVAADLAAGATFVAAARPRAVRHRARRDDAGVFAEHRRGGARLVAASAVVRIVLLVHAAPVAAREAGPARRAAGGAR